MVGTFVMGAPQHVPLARAVGIGEHVAEQKLA